jgi:hypothetical protein
VLALTTARVSADATRALGGLAPGLSSEETRPRDRTSRVSQPGTVGQLRQRQGVVAIYSTFDKMLCSQPFSAFLAILF